MITTVLITVVLKKGRMTQRVSFTQEMIVEAAFALTREEGWHGVTARGIAKKLGSSTMPIYSSLKSMRKIEAAVRARAESLMHDFQGRAYTNEQPLDVALGYVSFARDERNLFRFLYVDRPVPEGRRARGRGSPHALGKVRSGETVVPISDQVPVAMRDPRILKSWIFTHGLASMLSSGVLKLPDTRIRSLLQEAGRAFFAAEKRKKEKGGVNERNSG
jgi:AcrR family transcriptional regulator